MTKTTRNLARIALLVAVPCLAGQDLTVEVEKPAVELGEPLVVHIGVRNNTTKALLGLTFDRYSVEWSVRRQDGATVVQWAPSGDVGSLVGEAPANSVRWFKIVAAGVAGIQQPGAYEMTLHYTPLDMTRRVAFTIVPGNPDALDKRAQALHDAALVPGEDGKVAAEALAALSFAVPASMLCDVLERNPAATYAVLPRLEATATAEASSCILRAASANPLHRPELLPALARLAKTEKDPLVRGQIADSLASLCASDPSASGCETTGRSDR